MAVVRYQNSLKSFKHYLCLLLLRSLPQAPDVGCLAMALCGNLSTSILGPFCLMAGGLIADQRTMYLTLSVAPHPTTGVGGALSATSLVDNLHALVLVHVVAAALPYQLLNLLLLLLKWGAVIPNPLHRNRKRMMRRNHLSLS